MPPTIAPVPVDQEMSAADRREGAGITPAALDKHVVFADLQARRHTLAGPAAYRRNEIGRAHV